MKNLKKLVISIFVFLNIISCTVLAEAYLEGDEALEGSGFLDGLDSTLIMANWYKIVLIIVAVLCFCGLLTSNIIWYKKNKRNKK